MMANSREFPNGNSRWPDRNQPTIPLIETRPEINSAGQRSAKKVSQPEFCDKNRLMNLVKTLSPHSRDRASLPVDS